MRNVPTLALAALTAYLALAPAAAQEQPPLDAKSLAQRVEVAASPVHAFRYNQPIPAPNQTKPLLTRRRAFYPAERVSLSFRLPPGATLAAPVRERVVLSLHDLLGAKLSDLGEAALSAAPAGVSGTLEWTVPEVAEGQYLLAARFSGEDGAPLATRSNVVFVTPEYPRLLAAARAALVPARQKAATADALVRDVSLPSTEMLVEDAEMRWSDFGQAPRDWDFVKLQLETAKAYADRLAAGEDPWKARTGAFTKAYRSEVDGTLQPYGLYVPPSYDAGKAWPMMVGLHGSGSNHLLHRRRLFGLGNAPGEQDYEAIRTDVAYPDVGFIVLAPYGRGESAGYSGIAEGDVLRVMEHAQKAYNVDPDRVHLTGLSMGGGGTWQIGLRYPDRFASISPVCGVADMDLMPWTAGWSALDRELMSLTGVSRLVENAGNQQVFVFHGDEDDAVSVAASRKMMESFEKAGLAGKSVHYFELPGVTHFSWDFAYRDTSLFRRVETIRRNPFPERVVYSTFSPRYNKAYWLRVDRIDRGFAHARVEATQKAGVFDVKADDVSAFSLLLSPAIAPAGKPIEVQVNGKRAYRGTPKGGVLSFAGGKGSWKTTDPWRGPAQGPPDHAEAGFRSGGLAQYGPHVYVYGTIGDEATTAASKAGAEMLADWGPSVRATWRVLADTEVTPELMATHDLVLVGTAATNRVLAGLVGLPIRQDASGTYVEDRKVAGPGATYRLLYPNPGASRRLVLVYGGGSPAALERFLPQGRSAPKFSLFADYLVIGEDEKVVLEGYFRDGRRIPSRQPAGE
ncbi:MAG TPA: prolyl oligopeptidase family serine peptidase [Vicinamibacteria bacterium]|nr:prolyl oligopeptidase family serine peptidase [Vicinamibacteria bacterium]